MKPIALGGAIALLGVGLGGTPAGAEKPVPDLIRAAFDALCASEHPDMAAFARSRGAQLTDDKVDGADIAQGRWRLVLAWPDGDEIRLIRLYFDGRLRRLGAEYWRHHDKDLRPILSANGNAACAVTDVRRLIHDEDGRVARLDFLKSDFETVIEREDLNPPPPIGRDPGGVTVALFDSGLNYTLPLFANRVARDAAGRMLGYDFWDLDDRPYDSNTKASPFVPFHHGTAVASLLAVEAPAARLVPFRYPDPDMSRMGDMVAAADAAGAVVVSMPMGSNNPDDWKTFADAARARPHMLFVVSAGNDGRNIDSAPLYPASLDIDNMIVVTSSTPFGKLARGSNWGAESVDLMVPAEKVTVTDHRGATGQGSGSSYAVPRVAALAARLLAVHPNWRAAEVKAAILARAAPSPYQRTAATRSGWIPNPADDR